MEVGSLRSPVARSLPHRSRRFAVRWIPPALLFTFSLPMPSDFQGYRLAGTGGVQGRGNNAGVDPNGVAKCSIACGFSAFSRTNLLCRLRVITYLHISHQTKYRDNPAKYPHHSVGGGLCQTHPVTISVGKPGQITPAACLRKHSTILYTMTKILAIGKNKWCKSLTKYPSHLLNAIARCFGQFSLAANKHTIAPADLFVI